MQQNAHELIMKTLLVLRHAQAVHSGEMSDHERPLTIRGVKDAQRIGRLLRGMQPSQIVCSTALRAVATAEVALQVAALNVPIQKLNQLYDSDLDQHFRVLQNVAPTVDRLLIVGHNPTLEGLATLLCRRPIVMRTGSLAIIAVAAGDWAALAEPPMCSLVGQFCAAMLKKQAYENEP
jgi:phosphohistidine phosphatase